MSWALTHLIVANWYNVDTLTSSPSQINFLLFCSLFTIVSVCYLELGPRFAAKCKSRTKETTLESTRALYRLEADRAILRQSPTPWDSLPLSC